MYSHDYMQELAYKALGKHGDAVAGEWVFSETGLINSNPRKTVHLLRRLSKAEERQVGPLVDYQDNIYEKMRRAEITARKCGIAISTLLKFN